MVKKKQRNKVGVIWMFPQKQNKTLKIFSTRCSNKHGNIASKANSLKEVFISPQKTMWKIKKTQKRNVNAEDEYQIKYFTI